MKKRFSIAIILAILFFTNCKKEMHTGYDAIITGSDMRMCICCGGLMINFDGETQPYAGDFKLIANPEDLGITENDKFPHLYKS
jgi:hypothetical protein